MEFTIEVNLVDILQKQFSPAIVHIESGSIKSILPSSSDSALPFMVPGFIDAHVHIESSMLIPSEFARLAVVHGTVATVSDPHEIANVCGIQGVEYMISNGQSVPFKFFFGAPSCVPATAYETAGSSLSVDEVQVLVKKPEIRYLSEMMNFPGVLAGDKEVMEKIDVALKNNKSIDGHAPGLIGEDARKYIEGGKGEGSVTISTDHECFTREEALDKLKYGMKIIIREGSAAKNFDALIDLLKDYPDHIMFCSDDKHPDSLVSGHINLLCKRAVSRGIDVYNVLKAACVNPVFHYNLDVGLLKEGNPADFILINNLEEFQVLQTYINGELVAENGLSLIKSGEHHHTINNFQIGKKSLDDFEWKAKNIKTFLAIEALDGQLITNKVQVEPAIKDGMVVSDVKQDLLKMVVINRYKEAPIAKALIRNFGLKQGALASSVAHDSHNVVAVGADDESLCEAVNLLIENKGGISCVKENFEMVIPLPVGGLMSADDGYRVAELYSLIDKAAKEAGCTLSAPFMTLSFMALLVIPHLKLSDKGLFDGDAFQLLDDLRST
jgi:adenine deaminase